MSYKCDIPEKKVNILLKCLRQSADRKTEVLSYNIISKTSHGRLCAPVITVIKKLTQPESDMLSAIRVTEAWRG